MSLNETRKEFKADDIKIGKYILLLLFCILSLIVIWFFESKITIYQVSQTGRVENINDAYLVQSVINGKIKTLNLKLNQEILEGDLLLSLDDQQEQLELSKAMAQKVEISNIVSQYEQEYLLYKKSFESKSVSKIEYSKSLSRLKQYESRLEQIELKIESLKVNIESKKIYSPISGVVGELRPLLSNGRFIEKGQVLATVIPHSKLIVRGKFLPHQAIGKIKKDQYARIRLDGFNWAQYGHINGKVLGVAKELREDFIQVEIEILNPGKFPIKLQHGLPAVSEIALESISPYNYLLRKIGHKIK